MYYNNYYYYYTNLYMYILITYINKLKTFSITRETFI